MSALVVETQRKARTGYQKALKIREECEMRFTIGMAKVNRWLPESFAKKSSVKLLGGLAVGAMLITATTFTYDQLRQDKAASPSSSSQIAEASQALAYWVQRDEAEEMTYDELSKNFIGIPSPGTKITHLESRIASLLADAARDPARNTPQLNREIERLDYEIAALRLSGMRDTSQQIEREREPAEQRRIARSSASRIDTNEQQRAADWHLENLDILDGMQFSGVDHDELGTNSYEQQRAEDGIQERLEVQRILVNMQDHGKLSSAERLTCETEDYPLQHELFDEAWQNLMGRPPFSEPTACEIDKYASRNELEEMLFNEIWNTVGSKFNVNQSDPDLLQDVTKFFGEDVVAILGYKVLIARLNQYAVDGHLSSTDMEHLDHEIDMMLLAAEPGQ